MLERMERWKDHESADDVARWRDASDKDRSPAIAELADFAQALIESRGFREEIQPLTFPRLRLS